MTKSADVGGKRYEAMMSRDPDFELRRLRSAVISGYGKNRPLLRRALP
jgi:hypothetical protein